MPAPHGVGTLFLRSRVTIGDYSRPSTVYEVPPHTRHHGVFAGQSQFSRFLSSSRPPAALRKVANRDTFPLWRLTYLFQLPADPQVG